MEGYPDGNLCIQQLLKISSGNQSQPLVMKVFYWIVRSKNWKGNWLIEIYLENRPS